MSTDRAFVWILVGAVAGYLVASPTSRYWNQDVQIYGGVMTSTPVADVWGYENDWEGCRILVAGANFVNRKELEMPGDEWQKFITEWAAKGSTSCHRKQ